MRSVPFCDTLHKSLQRNEQVDAKIEDLLHGEDVRRMILCLLTCTHRCADHLLVPQLAYPPICTGCRPLTSIVATFNNRDTRDSLPADLLNRS